MFAFARAIIRHKIAAVVLIGAGAFFMMPEGEEEPASNNPWAVQTPKAAAESEEPGIVGTVVTEATDYATEYLDDNGINPVSAADEHVARFDETASAFAKANK